MILMLCIISVSGFSQKKNPKKIDDTKRNDIIKLITLSHIEDDAKKSMDMLFQRFKTLAPNVKDEVWNKMKKEINYKEMTDMLVPIYDKYYTGNDIKELINFLKLPIGKKFISVQNDLFRESIEQIDIWGEKVSNKIRDKLVKDGVIKVEKAK